MVKLLELGLSVMNLGLCCLVDVVCSEQLSMSNVSWCESVQRGRSLFAVNVVYEIYRIAAYLLCMHCCFSSVRMVAALDVECDTKAGTEL